MSYWMVEYLFLLGRILYGGFFVLGGINHFRNLNMMSGYAGSKGVPAAKAGVTVSGLLIIAGGALVIAGTHITIAVICLAVFLVPVTYLMHDFWNEKEMMGRINQQVNFQKNVALLGAALFLLIIDRPWPYALHF